MATSSATFARSPSRLVAIVCAAQVLVQIGAFFWPALLPGMMPLWQLSNSEAGWITASFYGAYMVSVPVFVHLDGPRGSQTRLSLRCRRHRLWPHDVCAV
jgi:hypothetical protein